MSESKRTPRVNSLLKEVISEVIRKDVKNPNIHELTTVTKVDVSRDLHTAKVYISIIGDEENKKQTMKALQSASGFIGVIASKKVTMRYFPHLNFILDDSVEKLFHIDQLLEKIKHKESIHP